MSPSLARDPMFDDDEPASSSRKVNHCAQHGAYSKAVDRCPRCPREKEPVKPIAVKRRARKEINVLEKPERIEILPPGGGGTRTRWDDPVLSALRAAPGVWHRVAEAEDTKHATSLASYGRKSRKEFEYAAREATVYARFVGKPKK